MIPQGAAVGTRLLFEIVCLSCLRFRMCTSQCIFSYPSCMLLKGGAAQELIKRPRSQRFLPYAYEPQDADSSA